MWWLKPPGAVECSWQRFQLHGVPPWVVDLTQKDGPLFFSPLLSHMFLDDFSCVMFRDIPYIHLSHGC